MRNWIDKHLLSIEFFVSGVVAVGLAIAGYKYGLNDFVDRSLEGNRATLYGTLASVSGSLFGFAIAAISIALGLVKDERFSGLRQASSYPQLWRFFLSAIWWLGVSTLVAILALILDNDAGPNHALAYLMAFLTLFVSLQMTNCVWILRQMVYQISRPSLARPGGRKHTSPNRLD